MVQINIDVSTRPGGQLAVQIQLVGVSRDRTAEELRTAEDLYAAVSILAKDMARRSGGQIAFDLGPN